MNRQRLWVAIAIFTVPLLIMGYPVWEIARQERAQRASQQRPPQAAAPATPKPASVARPHRPVSGEEALPAVEADVAGTTTRDPEEEDSDDH